MTNVDEEKYEVMRAFGNQIAASPEFAAFVRLCEENDRKAPNFYVHESPRCEDHERCDMCRSTGDADFCRFRWTVVTDRDPQTEEFNYGQYASGFDSREEAEARAAQLNREWSERHAA